MQAQQVDLFGDLDFSSGKTSRELSPATAARTSAGCLRRSCTSPSRMPLCLDLRKGSGLIPEPLWQTDGALLGDYTMRSFGECPSEERASRLSEILEDTPLPKYYLSARACRGILDRAKRRGKALPEVLEKALRAQAVSPSSSEWESQGGGKGLLIRDEQAGTLDTGNTQAVATFDARGNGDGSTTATITGGHDATITDYTSLVMRGQVNSYGFKGKMGAKAKGIAFEAEKSPTLNLSESQVLVERKEAKE